MRRCQRHDARAVLGLWAEARSEHTSTADGLDDVERLIASSPAALLVAFEDDVAGAFWESAGYPRDPDIGRRVRNL